MNRALMAIAGFSLFVPVRAEDVESIVAEGMAAYQEKNYAKAAERFEAAVTAGAKNLAVPYSAACCHALLGQADQAFAWLDRARSTRS